MLQNLWEQYFLYSYQSSILKDPFFERFPKEKKITIIIEKSSKINSNTIKK